MCLGTFSRRGAVALATIYPLRRVRILAERFCRMENEVSYTIKMRVSPIHPPALNLEGWDFFVTMSCIIVL